MNIAASLSRPIGTVKIIICLGVLCLTLFTTYSHLNANENLDLPATEWHYIDHLSENKFPSPSYLIAEGKQELKIDNLIAKDFKDARTLHMDADSLFSIKAHQYYWFPVKIKNAVPFENTVLELRHFGKCWPFEIVLKEVEAYLVQNDIVQRIGKSGSYYCGAERDVRNIINPSLVLLDLAANQQSTMWVRFSHAEQCKLNIESSIAPLERYTDPRKLDNDIAYYLVSMGAIFILFILVLFLYIWFRDPLYLWFLLFSSSLMMIRLPRFFTNETFSFLFEGYPRLFIFIESTFAGVRMIAIIFFGIHLLSMKERYPKIRKLFLFSIALTLTVVCSGFFARTIRFPGLDYWYILQKVAMVLSLTGFVIGNMYLVFTWKLKEVLFGLCIGIGILFTLVRLFVVALQGNIDHSDVNALITLTTLFVMLFALALQIREVMRENQTALTDRLALEQQNSEQLATINKATFKFVPQAFLQFLGKKNILETKLGDYVEKHVTVLFSDIRDYTSLSEQLSPKETFEFVTGFNQIMGPIIQKNNGFINQYLGDGIMAIFPKESDHALHAAIEMQLALRESNREREIQDKPQIKMGIGLHTGSLVMGIIGDSERFDAATISDTVNVSSRIESISKHFGSRILLSEESFEKLQKKDDFNLRFLRQVIVKGKSTPIALFECFDGDNNESKRLKKQQLDSFQLANRSYLKQDFEAAKKLFAELAAENPADKTVQLFLEHSKEAEENSSEENFSWSGIEDVSSS
ncbi:adenylate/guanylate cyclase domain-containing protein [Chitinophagales bacterium]|nr:adenylate/guanylate cyclase domain-containing protein [Chitinophagales bacterium]